MKRFVYRKQKESHGKMLLSVAVFLVIVLVFWQGISSISTGTRKRQRESLENALMRGVTHCYALEGAYPETLDYLKEHYGLTYDESLFFVDYQTIGSNILPDITIIEREKGSLWDFD